ncbi:MAG: hypothetical protein GY833_09505, partial [Aestuariibacter sp.]|nr:hypothetical protein [Aestuariibacter sp.]
MTATAGLGSEFVGWSGGLMGNPTSIIMDGDKTVTATFDLLPDTYYSLTVATDGTGSGMVEPPVGAYNYISGTTVWLTATASPGSEFVGWSGGLVGNPTSIVLDDDKTVTATFGLLPDTYYTLTVATDGTGSGTVEPPVGAHYYISGTTAWLTATASPGSEFVGWSGGLVGNPTSIVMDGDKAVTATFNLLPDTYYTLTVATDGTGSGAVEPPVGTHSYISGTTVWLTATASPGSEFVGWSGGLVGNPTSIVIDGDKVVTATFGLLSDTYYTLTVATDGTGSGTVDPPVGAHYYISGTTAWLTATANANSTFDGWSGAVNAATNSVSVTMDSDKTITATFSFSCTNILGA